MAKRKARPVVPLVTISNEIDGSITYRRFEGRSLTHEGNIEFILDADDVEQFRQNPEAWYAQS